MSEIKGNNLPRIKVTNQALIREEHHLRQYPARRRVCPGQGAALCHRRAQKRASGPPDGKFRCGGGGADSAAVP